MLNTYTAEYFYINPAFNVICLSAGISNTAQNQLVQQIGSYIQKDNDKLLFYSGGKLLLEIDINNIEDIYASSRAFCDYCSLNHSRAKEQLQSLVMSYI